MADSRKENEKEFFNNEAVNRGRNIVNMVYSDGLLNLIRGEFRKYLIDNCNKKNVLELGCGIGSAAPLLAQNGATVLGIDISDGAIKVATEEAKKNNLQNISYEVMDAENLKIEDSQFDLVCGVAILHHLDLNLAMKEFNRVIKPDGKAAFLEPLGHNPFINLFRKLTPHLRTDDEHPLTKKEIQSIVSIFKVNKLKYFYLTSLLALPLKSTVLFAPAAKFLNWIDQILFAIIPPIRFLAWQVLIIIENPNKSYK